MTKKRILFLGIAVCAALSFFSCMNGLEPAWKAGSTVVSLKLGGAISAISKSNSGRAVFSGDGYLYIRPGGAPSGSQRFFGPYTVKAGETFTTTDISSGDYSFMAILFSTVPIADLYFYNQDIMYYVRDVLQADDSTFRSLTNGSYFNQAFTEAACGKILEDVTIVPGDANHISAILDPLTSWTAAYYNGDGFYWDSCNFETPASETTLVRRFVIIEGLALCTSDVFTAYAYMPNFYATITPNTTGATVTLANMRFYGQNGNAAGLEYTAGTYSDTAPASVVYYNTGSNSNYLYLEYYATGPVTISPHYSD